MVPPRPRPRLPFRHPAYVNPMSTIAQFYREKAATCRRLADRISPADDPMRLAILDLAAALESRAAAVERALARTER